MIDDGSTEVRADQLKPGDALCTQQQHVVVAVRQTAKLLGRDPDPAVWAEFWPGRGWSLAHLVVDTRDSRPSPLPLRWRWRSSPCPPVDPRQPTIPSHGDAVVNALRHRGKP
jgi:hypothetical protein